MATITPVAAQIRPPDFAQGLGTLSSLATLQGQQLANQQRAQDLQTGQYTQAGAQADSQQAQQRNRELQAASGLVTSGVYSQGKYRDQDGNLDRGKLADDILSVAPTYGQPIVSSLLSQANEIVTNKQAHQTLSRNQQEQMGSTFGALATKQDLTNSDFIDALNTLTDQNRDPQFKRMAMSMLTHLPPNASPQDLQNVARRWSVAATGAESATAQTNPAVTTYQAPGGLQPIQGNPQAPGGIAPIGKPLPQGIAPQIITNPTTAGQAIVGGSQGTTPRLIGGASGGGSSGWQPITGQPEALQDINNARGAATELQTARNANAHLLALSADTLTGPVSAWSAKAAAAAGLSQGSGIQEIDAYLQRSAMTGLRALPHTNADLESAQKMTGTTSYTPQALQEKVKFTDALNSGALAYTKGLNAAVGTGPNPDLSHYNAFKAAWGQNFDPDVYRWEDAQRRQDPAEMQAIRKRLGPQGMKQLARKSAALAQLEQGAIPGG